MNPTQLRAKPVRPLQEFSFGFAPGKALAFVLVEGYTALT
jgi:hypothetical protein